MTFIGQLVTFWVLRVFMSSSHTFSPLCTGFSPAYLCTSDDVGPLIGLRHAGSRKPEQHRTKGKENKNREKLWGNQKISSNEVNFLVTLTSSENNFQRKVPKMF